MWSYNGAIFCFLQDLQQEMREGRDRTCKYPRQKYLSCGKQQRASEKTPEKAADKDSECNISILNIQEAEAKKRRLHMERLSKQRLLAEVKPPLLLFSGASAALLHLAVRIWLSC